MTISIKYFPNYCTAIALTLLCNFGKKKRNVGWVERSETQQYRDFWLLGFTPQTPLTTTEETSATEWLPNLRLNS
ncbi:MAG: hypothetical protein QNJ51_29140 [Calothrix sp. MO_167.B12]|nr:hypothetical protein [Calothrix sp. MO_167.B12]